MNDRGYQAFKEALLARVYGGTIDGQILLKEMISGGSDFSKTFTNAMVEAMPAMARLESAIAAGDLDASYSIYWQTGYSYHRIPDMEKPIQKANRYSPYRKWRGSFGGQSPRTL